MFGARSCHSWTIAVPAIHDPLRVAVHQRLMEDLKMTTRNLMEPLEVGTIVKILNSGYRRARIAEERYKPRIGFWRSGDFGRMFWPEM